MLALLGYPEQSTKRTGESIALAESLGHPPTRFTSYYGAILVALTLRDAPAVAKHAGALVAAAEESGGSPGNAPPPFFQWLRGWGMFMGGQRAEGIAVMREGVDAMLSTNNLHDLPQTLGILCEAYSSAEQPDEGIALLAKSRAQIDSMGGNYNEAELHRVRGELLRASSGEDDAEAAFRQALEVARHQQARLLELRASVSLARLLQSQRKITGARALLSEIYGWFTEGFDTADLQEAKALLDELR